MTDWKPGDRFTIEFEVADIVGDLLETTDDCVFLVASSAMVRAAKLPPKARPVRKGDEVHSTVSGMGYELRAVDGDRVWVRSDRGDDYVVHCDILTHADGAPIDWEASE